jgi:hypothetical protein
MNIPEPDHTSSEPAWTGDLRRADTAEETIDFLRAQLLAGKPWYPALLEAVAMWTRPDEVVEGRRFRYLIGDEAFDWLLLAERLTEAVGELVPEEERCALLFFNRPPEALDDSEFRARIGPAKYRAHLNYLYGVMLEEALLLAVELEVQKEQQGRAWSATSHGADAVYERIYGEPLSLLLRRFRLDARVESAVQDEASEPAMTWTERKEFTYWLFKLRVSRCDRARVASDTRKALNELNRQWSERRRKEAAAVEGVPVEEGLLELRPLAALSIDPPEVERSGFDSSSSSS